MKRLVPAALLIVGLAAIALVALRMLGDAPSKPVVTAVRIAQAADGGPNAFVYATITIDRNDELIGASVAPVAAASASLQIAPGGVVVGGHLGHLDGPSVHNHGDQIAATVTPSGPLTLEPGGLYIRLESVAAAPGDSIDVEFRFDSGATVTATAQLSI